ncbi:MAG: T9SS type A sorting domain-containing protein, partial [Psychroflexus sp.]|nr:T9SS type A sorting domain-containing protein [Psychroflexus sp.]
ENVNCTNISNISSPNNSSSDNISAQSVDVSWTSVDNYIGSYNYLILLADDDPLNDPAVTSGSISNDINNLSINQLQANTPYDFYLQSTCDNSLSDPLKFTTNTISTDQFTADNLKVYPNPVNAELNLSLSNNQNIEKISIFDISGKLVKVDKFSAQNQVQINLEQLNSGVYMAKIYADNHTSSESLKNNHL